MDHPTPQRLPCGCCGRCGCRTLTYLGCAVTAVVAMAAVLLLGVFAGIFGGRPGPREVLHVGVFISLCMLGVSLIVAAVAAGCAAIIEGRQSAREIWRIAKMSLGMAAGSVAGSGVGCLLLLLGGRR